MSKETSVTTPGGSTRPDSAGNLGTELGTQAKAAGKNALTPGKQPKAVTDGGQFGTTGVVEGKVPPVDPGAGYTVAKPLESGVYAGPGAKGEKTNYVYHH